jgi:hypothetical protein
MARSSACIAPAVPRCKPRHSGVGAWPSQMRTSGPTARFRGDQNCPWFTIDYVPSMPEMTLSLGLHPENTPAEHTQSTANSRHRVHFLANL